MPAAAKRTPPTEADADRLIAALLDEQQRADATALLAMLRQVTKLPARLWGPNTIGFGEAQVTSPTGRASTWFLIGFAPRKGALTLFTLGGWSRHADLLKDLGPHTLAGEGTLLHLKRLADVKLPVLKNTAQAAFKHAQAEAKQTAAASGSTKASAKKK